MQRKWYWATLLLLPLAIGGWAFAGVQTNADVQSSEAGFVCPITGEELPCSKCCPLN